jgi:hypothetical protein
MTFSLTEIAARFKLHRRLDRWTGPCPKCGGSARSDKFNLRDDGGFKCYGCDFKGDAITWLREMEGMSCPEAHEAAGKNCEAPSCPVYATCRMGDGSGKLQRRARPVAPIQTAAVKTVATREGKDPAEVWRAWAADLVESAARALPQQSATLAWLQARGISAPAVRRHCLGWIERSSKVDRASIGLPPERDGKTTLWIPVGLVIPYYSEGQLLRVKIRRTDEARAKFLEELKYPEIEGGGKGIMVIRPAGESRGMVVIEAELDAIACASAHPDVTVIALGTVSASLTPQLTAELAAAPVILVALDADPGKDGKAGAGPKAIAAWCSQFRQAKYWPVPAGKDPGDFVRDHGGDLRTWIDSGLPPRVSASKPASMGQDDRTIPLSDHTGGAGTKVNIASPVLRGDRGTCGQSVRLAPVSEPVHGVSGGGRPFIIVNTRGQFRQMTEQHPGVAVVGRSELGRIDPEATEFVLMAKNIFPGCAVLRTDML